MEIEKIGVNRWEIGSDSGNTYTVQLKTRLDDLGSMFFSWKCDCMAGQHGRECKHVRAVERRTEAVDDQALERIN